MDDLSTPQQLALLVLAEALVKGRVMTTETIPETWRFIFNGLVEHGYAVVSHGIYGLTDKGGHAAIDLLVATTQHD